MLIHAAAETGEADFIEQYMPLILTVCTEKDEYEFLLSLLPFYQKERQAEKLAAAKKRLLSLLPGMGFNQYFEEAARQKIESF